MKKFENPEILVQDFSVEDVVTASIPSGGGGGAWEEELPM